MTKEFYMSVSTISEALVVFGNSNINDTKIFTFYDNLLYLVDCLFKEGVTIYKIEPLDKYQLDKDYYTYTTTSIRIVEKMTSKKIWKWLNTNVKKYVKSNDFVLKRKIISLGIFEWFDTFINDIHWIVRNDIAKYGRARDLDILVNDPDYRVRLTVAKFARYKDMSKLSKDPSESVRAEVAKHCIYLTLNKLMHDESVIVRMEVAKRGLNENLDVLVHDKSPFVRAEVAKHGRNDDLDILVRDECIFVRTEVAKHMRPQDLLILATKKHSIGSLMDVLDVNKLSFNDKLNIFLIEKIFKL